nr:MULTISPECIES: BCCT family transporter [unclassified Modicisalibacter]
MYTCCMTNSTVGPFGFLATQVSFGLHELFGFSQGYGTQLVILAALGAVYVTSAMTGIGRGIQMLSRFNVFLALAIAAAIFIFGPTLFLTNAFTQGFGEYLSSFFRMATMTAETAPAWWMKWWTVFFFAWFIGYGPLMAIFVARISRGRTIRQMILSVAVMAPIATTGDSMSYAISVVGSGHDDPSPLVRAFWGIVMALMAATLLYMGAGQIGVLQQFIVITAIPVSLVLLPSLWTGPQAARAMAREQGLLSNPTPSRQG